MRTKSVDSNQTRSLQLDPPNRWKRLKDIVVDAAALDPAQRQAFVVKACDGDRALLVEVQRLVANLFEPQAHQAALAPGEILASRFEIGPHLGSGGMGEVYQALDLELGGHVALKVLRPHMSTSPEFAARFRREVQLARRVTHPNICRIFDVGNHEGRLFLTMELINGETLAQILRSNGPFSLSAALPVLTQLAAGLDELHRSGIVHRDFKPANVMLCDEGRRAVINDFGLARLSQSGQADDSDLSATGLVIGTPAYMAPEQRVGGEVSPATDIFALGLVIFEMVTGTRYTPASEIPSSLPPSWQSTIAACLDLNPALRPASASAVVALLQSAPVAATASKPPAPRRWPRPILLIPAALILLAVLAFAPRLRDLFPIQRMAGAHGSYLKAKDALDHYYRKGGVETAIDLFSQAIAEDPNFALAYDGLARANFLQFWQLEDTKYVEPALAAANRALALDPNLASVHVTLGMLYTQTGKSDLATAELHSALRLDSLNAEAYYAQAELFSKQGRAGAIEPALRKAVDLSPRDWRFLDELGYYYVTQRKFNEGIELHKQAVSSSPGNPRALTNLGLAYFRAGRLDEAIATYEKANSIEPGYRRLTNLAAVYEQKGEFENAAAAIRKAVDLNPGNYLTWGNLARAYSFVPGREADANAAYLKAIELGEALRLTRPNDALLAAMLGTYYASTAQMDKSLPLLRQAAALAPGDEMVLFQISIGYESGNLRKEALRFLKASLSHGLPLARVKASRKLSGLVNDAEFQKFVKQYDPSK